MKHLKHLFTPSGNYLYDCIIPAVILMVGIVLAVCAGVLRRELAWVCFAFGGFIHVLGALVALSLRKHGRDNGKSKRTI